MIHYHGTPISPRAELDKLAGKHFCVSYARTDNLSWCIKNAQSIMFDNGAFSSYTRGQKFNAPKYIKWLDDKLYGANWAVIPDMIDGDVEDQVKLISKWPYPKHVSAPVWHMHLSLDWLWEIVDNYPRFCFGSSGEYWKVGDAKWSRRADQAWDLIQKSNTRPWVHMMRGLKLRKERWPFASADSTYVARGFKDKKYPFCPKEMCEKIDAVQTPLKFTTDIMIGDNI